MFSMSIPPDVIGHKNSGDISAAAVVSSSFSGGLYPPLLLYYLSLSIEGMIGSENINVAFTDEFLI